MTYLSYISIYYDYPNVLFFFYNQITHTMFLAWGEIKLRVSGASIAVVEKHV